MMDVIAPLGRIKARGTVLSTHEPAGFILGVLRNEMNLPPVRRRSDLLSESLEHVLGPIILDRMHSIKTQSIEPILVEPMARVSKDEIADHARAFVVEIDRGSPRSVMFLRHHGSIYSHVVPFWPVVIID